MNDDTVGIFILLLGAGLSGMANPRYGFFVMFTLTAFFLLGRAVA